MRLLLLAAAGGSIGAASRYLVNLAAALAFGPAFPWATMIVNIVGSFLMGAVVAAAMPLLGGSAAWRTFLATGILGGFTTFSAFSLDAFELLERRSLSMSALYVVSTVILSLAALVAGMSVVRTALR